MAHSAEDLDAGETVILTLKDRNILEEGDDDAEELEDVLAVSVLGFRVLCHWDAMAMYPLIALVKLLCRGDVRLTWRCRLGTRANCGATCCSVLTVVRVPANARNMVCLRCRLSSASVRRRARLPSSRPLSMMKTAMPRCVHLLCLHVPHGGLHLSQRHWSWARP